MNPVNGSYEEGFVMLLDKSYRWTSFDVVKKIRNITKIKKVGHAGTLDPLATGLLIICAGKKTKQINSYMGMDKTYTGVIRLGETTPSFDLEKEVSERAPVDHLNEEIVRGATAKFLGDQTQLPPMFSAVKKGGKRLYDLAREGKEVEVEPRHIIIESFTITAIDLPNISFSLRCSKGTYVRSLVRDFAAHIGTVGVLTSLRREAIGDFNVGDAISVEEFQKSWEAYAHS